MIKDIENLKVLTGKAARFSELQPMIKELMQQKNEMYPALKQAKQAVYDKEIEMETLRKEMEAF
jgi:hypothetical protein